MLNAYAKSRFSHGMAYMLYFHFSHNKYIYSLSVTRGPEGPEALT